MGRSTFLTSISTPRAIALVCAFLVSTATISAQTTLTVPPGTILPIRLNQAVSSRNTAPGKTISGRIMQDVPLPNGKKIPAGAKITGTVTAVQPATSGAAGSITLRFDALLVAHRTIPVAPRFARWQGSWPCRKPRPPNFLPALELLVPG